MVYAQLLHPAHASFIQMARGELPVDFQADFWRVRPLQGKTGRLRMRGDEPSGAAAPTVFRRFLGIAM